MPPGHPPGPLVLPAKLVRRPELEAVRGAGGEGSPEEGQLGTARLRALSLVQDRPGLAQDRLSPGIQVVIPPHAPRSCPRPPRAPRQDQQPSGLCPDGHGMWLMRLRSALACTGLRVVRAGDAAELRDEMHLFLAVPQLARVPYSRLGRAGGEHLGAGRVGTVTAEGVGDLGPDLPLVGADLVAAAFRDRDVCLRSEEHT